MRSRSLVAVGVAGVLLVAGLGSTGADSRAPRVTDLPAQDCKRQARPVVVTISRARSPETIDHFEDAFRGRDDDGVYRVRRQPRVMHWSPAGADRRRAAAMRASGLPSRPDVDRDEISPASSREGGAGSDVRYVDDLDNQIAGAVMGGQLRRFCPGQAFRLVGR